MTENPSPYPLDAEARERAANEGGPPVLLPASRERGKEPPESAALLKLLDVGTLKEVHAKCTARYEGRYPSPLFGKNVELSPQEIGCVSQLLDVTRANLDRISAMEPAWASFERLLQEKRDKFGSFGEASTIVGDDSATGVSKEMLVGERPGIRVPARVKALYAWDGTHRSVSETLREYAAGLRDGMSAQYFGNQVKELYRFNKQVAEAEGASSS